MIKEEHHERESWNDYFKSSLESSQSSEELKLDSLWWQIVNRDIHHIVSPLMKGIDRPKLLEAGCGAARSSIALMSEHKDADLSLLDISEYALAFARKEAERNGFLNVQYLNASLFNMPVDNESFDLTWNVGVIEHYDEEKIEAMIKEMWRTVKDGGFLVIGIPNRKSIPVIKAYILGSNFGRNYLSVLPGYRYDTEKLYSDSEASLIIERAIGKKPVIRYAGSPIWNSASDFLVKFLDSTMQKSMFSFITLFILRK